MVKNKNLIYASTTTKKGGLKRKKGRLSLFDICNISLMLVAMIITFYPFWHQLVLSFEGSTAAHIEGGLKIVPREFTIGGYTTIFKYRTLWLGFFNSCVRVVVGVVLTLAFTLITAYPLSKKDLPFNKAFTTFLFITMLIGGGLIPSYLLIRSLNLFNTIWAVVLPSALSAYNVFIVRNFYKTLPLGVEESALIDGAGWWRILFQIVIPMSVPVIAVIALWATVSHWNSWFDALLYLQEPGQITLPVLLKRILIEDSDAGFKKMAEAAASGTDLQGDTVESAILIVSLVPMLLLYPFLQKYFVKGINVGSMKG